VAADCATGPAVRGWIAAALTASVVLAWANFLGTAKWAALPGALHGWRGPYYLAALAALTILGGLDRRQLGRPARLGRILPPALLVGGIVALTASLLARLPLSTWTQLPFQDDWTELYQQSINGAHLLKRGSFVGWNWWLLGGYPTSTDIAQNLAALTVVPMSLFGERLGYHALHAVLFVSLPALVWIDLRRDDRETATIAAALACFFSGGLLWSIGNSGDTNSLAGAVCAALAIVGSGAAGSGRRWGGPLLLAALTLGLYSHPAFVVYSAIFVTLEAVYFRDVRTFNRLLVAGTLAGVAALPLHWESLRYHAYVSFNNTVYDPTAPTNWPLFFRTVYYNVEILAFPHRWFNDYRSIANVWLPVLLLVAVRSPRSRVGFYAWSAVVAQGLLRLNTSEAGAVFDRVQHMLPLLTAPALAGFATAFAGTRRLAASLAVVWSLYVAASFVPVRHLPELRAFDPPLIDRISALDGNMILVETSPHRDMDADPLRRTPQTPFHVHFEGLLPGLANQRFYSQMIDGWVWNIWRGEVVGAGTFAGRAIDLTPPDRFAAEMHRWGVRHLLVWTDASRDYLRRSGRFVEQWRESRWSHFELPGADVRSVVTKAGRGELRNLDFLGADVMLSGVEAGEPIIVRTHYYPAWRASAAGRDVPLFAIDGQLAFRAPHDGDYRVQLWYPRYRAISVVALMALILGVWTLSRWPRI